ncbi:major facilitator superfamily domain-containing protein 3, partial [Mantella aurantiaca]
MFGPVDTLGPLLPSLSSPYIPLGVLYFVQGFPYGLQSGLLPVLLRTQGLSLSHIGLSRVLYVPWLLKVMWSPLVGGVWSLRRWLLVCTGGLCGCCLLCSVLPPESAFTYLVWLLLLMHILSSMQDVALDAWSVRVLTREQAGVGNSLQVVAYKLGSVVAGGGALTVMERLGWRPLFIILSAGYLMATLCAWWARALKGEESAPDPKGEESAPDPKGEESAPRGHPKESTRRRSLESMVRSVFRVPGTGWTIIYVLIYKLGEQGSLAMVPLLLLDHGVSPADLGLWNGILALVASIVGSALGGMLLGKGRSIKSLLRTVLTLRLSCLVIQTLLLSALGEDTSLVKVCLLLSVVMQHFLAGFVTSVTFTLMMHCTRQAPLSIQ